MKSRICQIGLGAALLAILCVCMLVFAQDQAMEVLRAQKFELVNSAGKVIAVLAPDKDDNGSLTLRDRFGRNRVKVAINPDDTVSIQCLGSAGEIMGSLPGKVAVGSASTQGEPASSVVYGSTLPYGFDVQAHIRVKYIDSSPPLVSGYTVGVDLKNTTSRTYEKITITVIYYDENGARVYSDTQAFITHLRPGKTANLGHDLGRLANGAIIASCKVVDIQVK